MPNRQVGSSVRARKGDTVWAITSRALEGKLGRKPTNAEINKTMRNSGTSVPSGDINKIKPGDLVKVNLRGIGAAPTKKPTTRGQDADAARAQGRANRSAMTRGQTADAGRYAGQAKKATAKKATAKKATAKKATRSNPSDRHSAGRRRGEASIAQGQRKRAAKKTARKSNRVTRAPRGSRGAGYGM